jgi:SAM-dependent methyltransferase
MCTKHTRVSAYDKIARIYDPWSRTVVEDVSFYVEEAVASGGPVLELGVGSGRIAVPVAAAGIEVVGVDLSTGMLEVARESAELAGVTLELHHGDMRDPPVEGEFPLVIAPFRSLLHMETDADRRSALRAVRTHLVPKGRFVFDVFAPSREDIVETHGRWLEREPGIHERAMWNPAERSLTLSVRTDEHESTMELWWVEPRMWAGLLAQAGFSSIRSYGWFDLRPLSFGSADSVWVAG